MDKLDNHLDRVGQLLDRLEYLVADSPGNVIDWNASHAFRWRGQRERGYLQPIRHPQRLRLTDLRQIDRQKAELDRNTRQFLARRPYNNVLLWGARGTGKSSLIKALFNEYEQQGLRLIEVEQHDLIDLPDIVEPLYGRSEQFLLFCDDLSFAANDPSYTTLKAVLDGSLSAAPDNVMVCATSNRRHLLPEFMLDNQQARYVEGELHENEAVEEKISLSERFGLWLAFHPFSQNDYLTIVDHWLKTLGYGQGLNDAARSRALQWALQRGSRSGRVAWQFARDWVGRQGCSR